MATAQSLRVGIMVVSFPTPSETFIVTKVLGLLEAGVDVIVFSQSQSKYWNRFQVLSEHGNIKNRIRYSAPTGAFLRVMLFGGIYLLKKLLRHPLEFMRFIQFSWKNRQKTPYGFWRGFYLRSVYIGEKLDILHFEFDMQAIGSADIKEYLQCKLSISVRGTIQNSKTYYKYPDLGKWLFPYVDSYHFISHNLHNNMEKLGLPISAHWMLIEPAIDLGLFSPAQNILQKTDVLNILSVGRLDWAKGYEFALDAIALVRTAGIRVQYTILGEGSFKEAILFAAQQHGLLESGDVTFVGAVPREQVLNYYAKADIFLHAALEEGFCNAVIEAQAMGLPCVVSDAGGLPENVEDGITGFVVPRRNPTAMAEKLLLLVGDPEVRKQMGEAGRRRVADRFDLRDQIRKFRDFYEQLAQMPIKTL